MGGNHRTSKASAPGKLILSGEHAVLYGAPALAIAIPLYVNTELSSHPEPVAIIHTDLQERRLDQAAFESCYQRARARFAEYQAGQLPIYEIFDQSDDFIIYVWGLWCERMQASPLGWRLSIEATLPMGCGLGSSAALIIAIFKGCEQAYGKPMLIQQRFELAHEAEHAQHGRSSGVDIHCALHGGVCLAHQGALKQIALRGFPLLDIILTGQPASATGECVDKVSPCFEDASLVRSFAQVAERMCSALQTEDVPALRESIACNHALLCEIGVVPQRVQDVISALKLSGIAAKVCGAGAIKGDAAGALWAFVPDEARHRLQDIVADFGYDHRFLKKPVETI